MHAPAVRHLQAVRIVHQIPGRLRLRLGPSCSADEALEAIRRLTGVQACEWSPRTRGLLVLYETRTTTPAAILGAARGRGAAVEGSDAELNGNGPDSEPESPANPRPALASALAAAFGELDRAVLRSTQGLMGLGGIVPVALALWAVREVTLGRFAPLGWSSALWYAHGLFRDYNTPSP